MKKAFTLVELTAVLVILGVLLMIIIPIVNNSINESKQRVYDEQIDRVINEAIKYSVNNNLGYEDEMYKTLPFDELIKDGLITEIPVDPFTGEELEGCIIYSWMNNLDNYDIKYDKDCDTTDDNAGFIVTIDLVPSKTASNGWVNSDYTVDVVTNGESNKHCISNTTCTPNIENTDININIDGIYTVCAVGIKGSRQSETVCKEFKLDKFTPTIVAKQENIRIEPNTDSQIKDYFTTTFGISGGEYSCNFTNTNELSGGNNNVTCTATSNSGLETRITVNFKVIEPNLMMSGYEFQNRIGNYRDTITEVNFLDSFSGKYETATIKWDFSKNYNEVVLGYIEEIDGKQILNIEADGVIIAHEQMGGSCGQYTSKQSLFCRFLKVESINFNGILDTSRVVDMESLFNYNVKLQELDLSGFDTSNVIDMSSMFYYDYNLNSLNISGFDTSNVTNMYSMFCEFKAGTQIEDRTLDLSHFDTSLVTSMSYMFAYSGLVELDLSGFNTSNVVYMNNMFSNSDKLNSLNIDNFNTSKVNNMSSMFSGLVELKNLDVSSFNTSNVTNMSYMFYYLKKITSLDLSSFNTSNVTNMNSMFYYATILTDLNVSSFDTSNVIYMDGTFSSLHSLESLDLSHFNTSNVVNMSQMFRHASGIRNLNISSFNTSKVVNMSNMFEGTSLSEMDLSHFDTSNVTDMNQMFRYTDFITLDLSGFNTIKVKSMYSMFNGAYYLENLNISSFDTSNVTNMSRMFYNIKIRNIDLSHFDTINVTNMSYMFYNMPIVSLDLSGFDTSNVTNMSYMFSGNNNLYSLDLSSFDTSKVTSTDNMFYNTYTLTNAYARTQADADRLNSSPNKASNVNFIVKP